MYVLWLWQQQELAVAYQSHDSRRHWPGAHTPAGGTGEDLESVTNPPDTRNLKLACKNLFLSYFWALGGGKRRWADPPLCPCPEPEPPPLPPPPCEKYIITDCAKTIIPLCQALPLLAEDVLWEPAPLQAVPNERFAANASRIRSLSFDTNNRCDPMLADDGSEAAVAQSSCLTIQ